MPKVLVISDYPMYEDIDGVLQKRKTPADLQQLQSPNDQIVVDMIALDNANATHGTTYYAVIPANGSEPYPYWNNPPTPDYIGTYSDVNAVEVPRVCGNVYCCLPGESAWAHNGRVGYCTGTGRHRR